MSKTLVITAQQLLANDTGEDIRLVSVGNPTNGGTAVLTGNTVTYTAPETGSTDSFMYTIVDSLGRNASATVHIKISGGAPPVIKAIDDDLTVQIAPAAKLYYFVRGNVLMTGHTQFTDLGFAIGDTFTILGLAVAGGHFSVAETSETELIIGGINFSANYGTIGVTAAIVDDNGFLKQFTTDTGFYALFRDTPFTDEELTTLPPKLFGTPTRGSKYVPGDTQAVVIPVADVLSNDIGGSLRVVSAASPTNGQILKGQVVYPPNAPAIYYAPPPPTQITSPDTEVYPQANGTGSISGGMNFPWSIENTRGPTDGSEYTFLKPGMTIMMGYTTSCPLRGKVDPGPSDPAFELLYRDANSIFDARIYRIDVTQPFIDRFKSNDRFLLHPGLPSTGQFEPDPPTIDGLYQVIKYAPGKNFDNSFAGCNVHARMVEPNTLVNYQWDAAQVPVYYYIGLRLYGASQTPRGVENGAPIYGYDKFASLIATGYTQGAVDHVYRDTEFYADSYATVEWRFESSLPSGESTYVYETEDWFSYKIKDAAGQNSGANVHLNLIPPQPPTPFDPRGVQPDTGGSGGGGGGTDPGTNPGTGQGPYGVNRDVSVRSDGGYNARRGVRIWNLSDPLERVYPTGTLFRVRQYDIGYTDTPDITSFSGMTIGDLIAYMHAAYYSNFYLIDSSGMTASTGVIYFEGTDTGNYDVIYRRPNENKFYHADLLFDQLATDRESDPPTTGTGAGGAGGGSPPPPLNAVNEEVTLTGTTAVADAMRVTFEFLIANDTATPVFVNRLFNPPNGGRFDQDASSLTYYPPVPPVLDTVEYEIMDQYGQTARGTLTIRPPTAAPSTGGSTSPLDGTPIRQVQSVFGSQQGQVVTMDTAPAQGSLLIAFMPQFDVTDAATGWTRFEFQFAGTRDNAAIAYKVVGANETRAQTPFNVTNTEETVTIFEIANTTSNGIADKFSVVDLRTYTYSRAEPCASGQIVIGVAVGLGGNVPVVSGATTVKSVKGGRATVQPFFSQTATTVIASVPNTQSTERFLYMSVLLNPGV